MKHLENLLANEEIFLSYMNERYPIFWNSNIFFRDVQYAVRDYFKIKEIKLSYTEAEKIASLFIDHLVTQGKLLKIDFQTWKVNFHLNSSTNEIDNEVKESLAKEEEVNG
ncbi:MAG: hypothetical protein K8F36_02535 [Melioribacteraceae bacterium]|nr:hypothetical protein [Melioribacteraceae bacterium]MCO6473396.1 hypothetical protein [Melioribacteraceae bacterium]MDD3559565.1 hypothetical protein [Melioribacteraceae bacterium]